MGTQQFRPPAATTVRAHPAACADVAMRQCTLLQPTKSTVVGALIDRDASLPPALRANTALNGAYVSWMHDNGAGNHSYSPYYSDHDALCTSLVLQQVT